MNAHEKALSSDYLLQIYEIVGECEFNQKNLSVITKNIPKAYVNIVNAGASLGYKVEKIDNKKLRINDTDICFYPRSQNKSKFKYILDDS